MVRGKKCAAALAGAAWLWSAGQSADAASIPLNAAGTPTPISFSNGSTIWAGSSASLNPAMAVGGSTTNFAGTFTADGTAVPYTTNNGIYAAATTSNPNDVGFGARVPVGNTLTLTIAVTNNTGAPMTGLTINWNETQWQDAVATPNNLYMLSDDGNGGTVFDANNLSGQAAGTANELQELAHGGTGLTFSPALSAAIVTNYTGAIPNGGSVQLQYFFQPGGGGNRPILGIDDLSITGLTSTPEPNSAAVIGAASLGLLARRRRRHVK